MDEAHSREAMLACIVKGVQSQPQASLPLQEQLWNFLRERHLLLVLDNTEQISEAGQVANELLQAAPGVKCLVTTRQPLGLLAEVKRELAPLPTSEAVGLFIETARHADILGKIRTTKCLFSASNKTFQTDSKRIPRASNWFYIVGKRVAIANSCWVVTISDAVLIRA